MVKIVLLTVGLFLVKTSFAQPTVGLVLNSDSVSNGYTLFTPELNNFVYLIDNCGEVINEWEFNDHPGLTVYLLPNGNLLRAGIDSLQLRDWDNNVLWTIDKTTNNIKQNHDIEPLPNGNILCIVNEIFTAQQIIDEGRNPAMIGANFRMNKIVEIQPIGSNQMNIVWEWKFVDHLIQDFDAAKSNYGVVADHPELLDINFDNQQNVDYTHLNGIDYNADLDQILLSARHVSELFIIDHSTTTAQAASNSGGNSNKGGDFIWRWGNPAVYRAGTLADQKLNWQHDGKWVEASCPDAGKISVFNNLGNGIDLLSSIHLIDPPVNGFGYDTLNGQFLPQDYDWSWQGSVLGHDVYESKKSSVIQTPNGNMQFCQNSIGQIAEVTKAGTLVWVYNNPSGSALLNQGDAVPVNENVMFRAEKYGTDYAGFVGRDLSQKGLIEDQNTLSTECRYAALTPTSLTATWLIINPVSDAILHFSESIKSEKLIVLDATGKTLYQRLNFQGEQLDLGLSSGIYFLNIQQGNQLIVRRFVVL